MTDATKRVAGGEGREVLLVSGEAGLGKTTLVAEAARAAFDTGACVLFGHCEEDLATPYQLFAEALGHYVTHAPEEQLLAHVEAHGSELSRLVPTLASRIRDLPPSKATDSDTERFLLFAAVVGLLATMSQEQPVVLVLDDLQWADKGSLLLLRHLAAAEPSHAGTHPRDLPGQRVVTDPSPDRRPGRPPPPDAASPASNWPDSTTAGWWHSWRRRPVTPSTTPGWAWPTPSTARPTATRSS